MWLTRSRGPHTPLRLRGLIPYRLRLSGLHLMFSYDPEGTKAALSELPRIDWQRCVVCITRTHSGFGRCRRNPLLLRPRSSVVTTLRILKPCSPKNNALD